MYSYIGSWCHIHISCETDYDIRYIGTVANNGIEILGKANIIYTSVKLLEERQIKHLTSPKSTSWLIEGILPYKPLY